jgi:hypothetical protein
MDAGQFAQFLQAIQDGQVATQAAIAAAAAPVVVANPDVSAYAGDALNQNTRMGFSLFESGRKPLKAEYDGKVESLYKFQAELDNKATLCCWNSGLHDITNVEVTPAVPAPPGGGAAIPAVTINLITNYGELTTAQVEAARLIRVAGADTRAKQNALMMYECIYDSITGDAKDRLISEGLLNQDGPTLLHNILSASNTATFSSAQSTRDNLAAFSPASFKYNIPQINSAIRIAIKKIRSAGQVTNEEIFHVQFKIYKKIKAPAEWSSYLLHLQHLIGRDRTYTPEQLYTDVENQHSKLVDDGHWKPSDRSAEEQAIAMMANLKQPPATGKGTPNAANPRTTDPDKQGPPFMKDAGKEGDTKIWKTKTYHWCPSKNHKYGQWHKHSPTDCKVLKKELADGGTVPTDKSNPAPKAEGGLTVDKEKILRGMTALFPDGDHNDMADGFLAALEGMQE